MKEKLAFLSILRRHLRPVLRWRTGFFIITVLLSMPRFARSFIKQDEEIGKVEFKKTFLLVGAIHPKLHGRVGAEEAKRLTMQIMTDIANHVQSGWYLPPKGVPRSNQAFHQVHEQLMHTGLIRHNQHDEIIEEGATYRFHVSRCLFYETFQEMGIPWLTEVFCQSDEVVFNNYSNEMRFHRGDDPINTIARGAKTCAFIFEQQVLETKKP